jgi:hypothetical protein
VHYRADFGGNRGGGAGKPTPKIRPERYITYFEGFWLRKGGPIRFNDYLPLFNWIKENKPEHEKNDLPYLVHGLSFLNYSINRNLKNWHHYVEPYGYYASEKSFWLKGAIGKEFVKPTDPIKWILENKPADDTNSIVFLFRCLRLCNTSVKDKSKIFAMHVNAFSYIINNEPAKKAINEAFNTLIKEGKRPEDITFWMIRNMIERDKMDLKLFTHLDNKAKDLAPGYVHIIIDVYLYFKKLDLKNKLHVPEFE